MDKPKCYHCHGTGFNRKGQICICAMVDKKEPELPKELKDLFGEIFKGGKDGK